MPVLARLQVCDCSVWRLHTKFWCDQRPYDESSRALSSLMLQPLCPASGLLLLPWKNRLQLYWCLRKALQSVYFRTLLSRIHVSSQVSCHVIESLRSTRSRLPLYELLIRSSRVLSGLHEWVRCLLIQCVFYLRF